jgi:endonuclease/exonuclease/phosphatase (EEP) superfamily protein YafD
VSCGWIARSLEVVGWLTVGSIGLLLLTQALGPDGFAFLATAQALLPYAVATTVVIAALAHGTSAHRLAVLASVVGAVGLGLVAPLVFPSGPSAANPAATPVTVASVNLLYSNPTIGAAADDLLDRDLDAILFTEYTRSHREALRSHTLAKEFPYRIEREGRLARGIALWSRLPLDEHELPDRARTMVDLTMATPDGPVRLIGVHPPTPLFDFGGWIDDLELFTELGATTTQPTLVIGDFNATYWHPRFRDLLDVGFTDAHAAHGRGLTTSWPTDELVPPFVRLDHALTGNGLTSTDIADFTVPGSDHHGIVVSVAPTR